jgi:hypothetical protein
LKEWDGRPARTFCFISYGRDARVCGTELNITQQGIPPAIPVEACYLGWQESLTLLAKLVEAEIPDQS